MDVESLRGVMGWNDFEDEPLSRGSPANAIMARDDLLKVRGGGAPKQRANYQRGGCAFPGWLPAGRLIGCVTLHDEAYI